MLYELMGFDADLSEREHLCREYYERALVAFVRRDWAQAIELLNQSIPLERFQPRHNTNMQTTPSLVLKQTCEHYIYHTPPANWDGVYNLRSK